MSKQFTFSDNTAATSTAPKAFFNVPSGTVIAASPESSPAGSCTIYHSISSVDLCRADVELVDFEGDRIGKAKWRVLVSIGSNGVLSGDADTVVIADRSAVVCVPSGSSAWRFEKLETNFIR